MAKDRAPFFDDRLLEITTRDDAKRRNPIDRTEWERLKRLLEGEKLYYNSQKEAKPMVGMLMTINDYPWNKERGRVAINHNVAFFKYDKDENWYYIDSNVHRIRTLEWFNEGEGPKKK
eukprot:897506_1